MAIGRNLVKLWHLVAFQGPNASRPGYSCRTSNSVNEVVCGERIDRLYSCLQRLPQSLQTILRWRYEDSLTLAEIAVRTGRSEDAVRMLIKRCLTRLRPEIFDDDSRL